MRFALSDLAAPALAAGPDPDARLIELGRLWQAAGARADASSGADFDAAMEVHNEVEAAIYATPAAGLAGLAVKARIAAQYLPGIEIEAVHDLVEEALRLSGRAV